MNIKPLADRVVIKRETEEQTTTGGIVIPDTAREKPDKGRVMAVGPGRWLDNGRRSPTDVKEGDLVLFAKYAGSEVKLNGEKLLVMREEDVMAVIES